MGSKQTPPEEKLRLLDIKKLYRVFYLRCSPRPRQISLHFLVAINIALVSLPAVADC